MTLDCLDNKELIASITRLVVRELELESNLEQPYAPYGDIRIGVSARHVHLCRKALYALFGDGYELTKKSALMGGQFSCNECVTLVGANLRAIENVRVLGPTRGVTQVEIAQTDAVRLGIRPPVRESGNIKGSAPISLIGPKGAVYLSEGCIVAKRHIHMSPADAQNARLRDGDITSVRFNNGRPGVLNDVSIRVDKSFTLEMHIDTDEANALGLNTGDTGVIIGRDGFL